jgi:hypothetical protein
MGATIRTSRWSRLQHAWATAVETIAPVTGYGRVFGRGSAEYLDVATTAVLPRDYSSLVARKEKGDLCACVIATMGGTLEPSASALRSG